MCPKDASINPLLTFSIFSNGLVERTDFAIRNCISPPVSVATSSENNSKLLVWSKARGEKGWISKIISDLATFVQIQNHNTDITTMR